MPDAPRVTKLDRHTAIVQGGHWAALSGVEKGVLIVLLDHSDYLSGRVRVGCPTIARLAGVGKNLQRVREACTEMAKMGIIRQIRVGRGGVQVAEWEVLAPAPIPGFIRKGLWESDEDDSTGTENVPVQKPNNQHHSGAPTGTLLVPNQHHSGAPTGTQNVPRSPPSLLSPPPPPLPLNGASGTAIVRREVKEEEEELMRVLVKRGIWDDGSPQRLLAQGLTQAVADRVWKDLVNHAKNIKDRGCVYFRRLNKFVNVTAAAPR